MTTTTEAQSDLICEECGSRCCEINGEVVCTQCGLVQNILLLAVPPVPQNGSVVEPHFATRYEIPYMTRIGRHNRLTPVQLQRANRLHRTERRLRGCDYRVFNALMHLDRYVGILALPHATHLRAATILRSALLHWNRTFYDSLIFASILYAAREHRLLLRPSDLLTLRPSSGHKDRGASQGLRRAYFFLQSRLGPVLRPQPVEYLPRLARLIGASSQTVQDAVGILQRSSDLLKQRSHNPVGLAAAALWLAGAKLSQDKIARTAGVCDSTLGIDVQLLKQGNGGES